MLRGHLVQSTVLILSSIAFLWSAKAGSQNPAGLPPLPAPDAVTAEIDQLRQESARLSQEARELGGGRTITDAASSVHNSFYEHKAQADELEQLAIDMGHTAEELRAEQRRIAETGRIGWGEVGKGTAGQVVDKVAEEAIKRFIAEVYGKIFGVVSFGKDCYDATRRIKLWLLTRKQAGALGDSAESVRQNWIALNEMLVALYGEMSLEAAKMRRLDAIQQRSRAIQDRIATLQQGAVDAQQPATSHAGTTRETDSGYDLLLDKIVRLKFERRIAALQRDDEKVRRLDREIAPLERQAEQAEQVPARGGIGLAPRPQHRTSTALLDYHNILRFAESSPPLKWNETLKSDAAKWAQVMASTGVLKHAPREGRPANQRENISLSPHGTNSPMKMARVWGNEKKLFRPGVFPNVCAGDWSTCAHYTQMVWSTTTEVGCAFVEGPRFDALVCRYSPPGNQDNKPVFGPSLATTARGPCPVTPAALLRKTL